ncbi:uncharacterized protein LOC120633456 [Pararge aegeria]|nr:uncharacterized protein LOC120633456 [Pararge aegeria]
MRTSTIYDLLTTVLISKNHDDLYSMIQTLDQECRKCGLDMNQSKTCIITNSVEIPTVIQSQTINYVNEYIYLGQSKSFEVHTIIEVERPIKVAWSKYWALKHIFKSKIPLAIKKKAMDTTILPTLLAAERSMLGLRLSDRQRNAALRNKTQLIDASVLACKWRWAGHLARSKDGASESCTGGPVTKAGRALVGETTLKPHRAHLDEVR